ncbi:AraC family transcriptional regulator [Streptomyces sp. NPDC051183]|uniref:helix-turn-helix domain-containing protein n=1 Tax=Streptomyces sp. NPDC051183 TaxID=3155165 RepID=UPI00341FAB12
MANTRRRDSAYDTIEVEGFPAPGSLEADLQVRTVREFAEAGLAARMARPHRADFLVVILFHGGPVTHVIDFTEYELTAGDLLWTWPGQVHHFSDPARYDATAVAVRKGFLPRATIDAARVYDWDRPPVLRPDKRELAGLQRALQALRYEYLDILTLPQDVRAKVLRHSVSVLLLRAAQVASRVTPSRPETDRTPFVRFRAAVERDYARTRSVSEYADRLGYSRRTLARSVRAATGQTPKSFIDSRVVLEAKRLLAHSDAPVSRIGVALGFPDAANFAKYFQQRSGASPSAFRSAERRDPSGD